MSKNFHQLKKSFESSEDEAVHIQEVHEAKRHRDRRIIFGFVIASIGLVGFFITEKVFKGWSDAELFRDIFLAVSAVGLVEFLNSILLSHETEYIIKRNVRKYLPHSLNNIRESGIMDYQNELDDKLVKTKIENSFNTHIRILRIRFIEFSSLRQALTKAITDNECTVEIILLSPYSTSLIEKRVRQMTSKDGIQNDIEIFSQHIRTIITEIGHLKDLLARKKTSCSYAFIIHLLLSAL